MGAVFKARQEDLGRLVAVKLLDPEGGDQDSMKRFEREAKSLSRLSHVHIAGFFSYGVLEDVQCTPYIVMEYIDGQSLAAVLATAEGGYLPEERVVDIALQVTEALEYAHRNNVIHRDLKPGNIILQRTPQADFVKLVDFGLSYLASQGESSQHLTKTGHLVGTPQYLSPEQCMGLKADHRSDIYALGCILFEMLSGASPFASESAMGLIHSHVTEKAPTLSKKAKQKISPGLNELVMNCLAKQADRRYQTMQDLHDDLIQIKQGQEPKLAKNNDTSSFQPLQKFLTNKLTIGIAGTLFLFASSSIAYTSYLKNSSAEARCAKSLSGKPNESKINEWIQVAEKLENTGDKKQARDLLKCIRTAISKSQVDLETKMQIQMKLAEHFFQQNDFVTSSEFIVSAIDALPKIPKESRKRVTRHELMKASTTYLKKLKLRLNQPNSAEETFEPKKQDSKNQNTLVNMNLLLALGYMFISDIDKAVEHAKLTIPIVDELYKTHHLTQDTLAGVQMIINAFDEATWNELEFLQREQIRIKTQLVACELVKAIALKSGEDSTDQLKRRVKLARAFIGLADWNSSRQMLESILAEPGDATPESILELKMRRAAVLEHLGDSNAIKAVQKAQPANFSALSRQMQVIDAEIWAANYQTAIQLLDKAMKTWQAESPDSLDDKISILRTYAYAWGDQGEYAKEEKYLREALADLKGVPSGSTKYTFAYLQVVKQMVDCLESQKRFAEANEFEVSSNLARRETMKRQGQEYPVQEVRMSP